MVQAPCQCWSPFPWLAFHQERREPKVEISRETKGPSKESEAIWVQVDCKTGIFIGLEWLKGSKTYFPDWMEANSITSNFLPQLPFRVISNMWHIIIHRIHTLADLSEPCPGQDAKKAMSLLCIKMFVNLLGPITCKSNHNRSWVTVRSWQSDVMVTVCHRSERRYLSLVNGRSFHRSGLDSRGVSRWRAMKKKLSWSLLFHIKDLDC